MKRHDLIRELDRIIDVGIVNAKEDTRVLRIARERLALVDKLYNHLNDLWYSNVPDSRTEPENFDKQDGIAVGLDYAIQAFNEFDEDIHNPRVLTVEELHKLPIHTIVWIEFWNNERGKSDGVIAGMMCKDRSIVDEETCVYDDFEKDMERNHGDCWRFWLGKPTDEQMKAVPWYWEINRQEEEQK